MPGSKAPQQERRDQIMQAAYAVAGERGLERLTIRQVAATAGLSSGLVLFHFDSREELLVELLEWLLESTAVLRIDPVDARKPPLERLCSVVRSEIHRLSEDPARIRLLFEYWVLGIRHEEIQRRMREDLRRYRDAFLPLAIDAVAAEPVRFAGVTPQGLAAVVVSFIKGYGIQTTIDLDQTDGNALHRTADHLLQHLGRAGARPHATGVPAT